MSQFLTQPEGKDLFFESTLLLIAYLE